MSDQPDELVEQPVVAIHLNYKSGTRETLHCVRFSYKKVGSKISWQWLLVPDPHTIRPLEWGMDDIESIFYHKTDQTCVVEKSKLDDWDKDHEDS